MTLVSVPREKLVRVLENVEDLLAHVDQLSGQDLVARRRLREMKADPSIRRTEAELDEYLVERGVDLGVDD